jgi:hypothetical protein
MRGCRRGAAAGRMRGGRGRTCAIEPVDAYISHIISNRDIDAFVWN